MVSAFLVVSDDLCVEPFTKFIWRAVRFLNGFSEVLPPAVERAAVDAYRWSVRF